MLPFGTLRAQVIGTPDFDRTDYRKKGLGPHFLEACRVTARTRRFQVAGIRHFELQQLCQGTGPGAMHRGPDDGLDTFQIELPGCPALAENDAQQLVYFAGDFFLDCLGRFFS